MQAAARKRRDLMICLSPGGFALGDREWTDVIGIRRWNICLFVYFPPHAQHALICTFPAVWQSGNEGRGMPMAPAN